jgi:hypothetical protein
LLQGGGDTAQELILLPDSHVHSSEVEVIFFYQLSIEDEVISPCQSDKKQDIDADYTWWTDSADA